MAEFSIEDLTFRSTLDGILGPCNIRFRFTKDGLPFEIDNAEILQEIKEVAALTSKQPQHIQTLQRLESGLEAAQRWAHSLFVVRKIFDSQCFRYEKVNDAISLSIDGITASNRPTIRGSLQNAVSTTGDVYVGHARSTDPKRSLKPIVALKLCIKYLDAHRHVYRELRQANFDGAMLHRTAKIVTRDMSIDQLKSCVEINLGKAIKQISRKIAARPSTASASNELGNRPRSDSTLDQPKLTRRKLETSASVRHGPSGSPANETSSSVSRVIFSQPSASAQSMSASQTGDHAWITYTGHNLVHDNLSQERPPASRPVAADVSHPILSTIIHYPPRHQPYVVQPHCDESEFDAAEALLGLSGHRRNH